MARIFISYRHADSEGHVGRLYDHLTQVFDRSEIFRDLDSLHGGEEFSPACKKAVEACKVFVAIIGPNWLNIRDKKGRRLDNSKDVVRREIATALKLRKRVIPVLVGHAAIPESKDLPGEISTLFKRKKIEIRPEEFLNGMNRLIQAIGGACGKVIVSQAKDWNGILYLHLPTYQFEVWVDQKPYGEFEEYKSITLRVEAGEHTISVRRRPREREWQKFVAPESNKLQFELKGGQTIHFSIECAPDKYVGFAFVQIGAPVIKHYQPVIKP